MKFFYCLAAVILFTIVCGASILEAQPANDECRAATVVSVLPFTEQINTRSATVGANDPILSCADGGGGNTVWYSFTPANDVFVSVNTRGSSPDDYDTALAIFVGSCDSLNPVLCNDDISQGTIRQSEIFLKAEARVNYIIHVAEWNGGGPNGGVPTGGDLVFNMQETPVPALFQGPESGSIAGGTRISTDGFTSKYLRPAGSPSRPRKAIPLREVTISKISKQPLIPPTAAVGANFIRDLAAATKQPVETDAPILLTNFQGVQDRGETIPPDPIMAAGPEHLIGCVNSEFGIFDKSGNLLKLIDASEWLNNVLPGTSPCDPQVVYDHHANRWIMIWIECGLQSPSLLLSVSDDDNPLGNWCNWRIPGDVNGSGVSGLFNDYPKLGVDDQAIYVTANMFADAFSYVQLRIIPKEQLFNNDCGPVTWTDLWDLRNPGQPADGIFTLVPAVTYGTPGVEYLVDVDRLQNPGTFMNLWSLSDPLSSTPTLTGVTVPVAAFTSPTNAGQLGGGEPGIDVGGRRVRNAVYQNGSLWTAHSVGNSNGEFARARYVKIDVATATATEDVAFGADDFWYYYPAVTVDANDNLVMAFTRSGTTEYASARYTGRLNTEPPGLQPSALLKAGEDNYVKTFGSGRNRWGDYMGIARDPAEPSSVWMFVEYAAQSVGPFENDDRWGTWFGRTTLNPLPGAQIIVQPTTIGFGKVVAGRRSRNVAVTILNQGDTELTIASISDPGTPFILSDLPTQPLSLGTFASATFEVTFAPDTGGVFTAEIAVGSNDQDDPVTNITLTGEGRNPPPPGTVLYVVNEFTGDINQIDPLSGTILNSIAVPVQTFGGVAGLAFDGVSLFYTPGFSFNQIYELDAKTGEVRNSFETPQGVPVDGLAHSGTSLLATAFSSRTIYELDPATGQIRNTVTAPLFLQGGLTYGGERQSLFAQAESGEVVELDPFTGGILNRFPAAPGEFYTGLAYSNGLNVLFAGSSFSGNVYALDADNGAILDTFPITGGFFASLSGLAADEYLVLTGAHLLARPESISFGKVGLGKPSAAQRVTLRNVGTEEVIVSDVSGTDASFQLLELPDFPLTLAPATFASFSVAFSPEQPVAANDTLKISSNDADGPVQYVFLSGIGVTPPRPGTLFASTGRIDSLLTIDPATGQSMVVGSTAGFGGVTEIEFREDGVLFGATDQGQILTLDPITGAPTLVASPFAQITGMEFDASGRLFGAFTSFSGAFSQLVTIDLNTGFFTFIGPIDFRDVGGLAFAPDGTLLGATGGFSEGGDLIRINLNTGRGTLIGRTGFRDVAALEFDRLGKLYGGLGPNDPNSGGIIAIEPSSGAGTLIGPSGFPGISGLAFLPGFDVTVAIGDTLKGEAGTVAEMPVLLELNADSVGSLGAIVKASGGILSFAGFTPGPIVPGAVFNVFSPTPDSVRIGFANLGGGSITQEGLLVTLRFAIAANTPLGATALLKITEVSATDPQGEILVAGGVNGLLTVVKFVTVAGNVEYCRPPGSSDQALPIQDLTAGMSQNNIVVRRANTDAAGHFTLANIVAGPNFSLSVRRANGGLESAVHVTDAFLAFNGFLGALPLSGCQNLAADVDANLNVQPRDALLIFNFFLGKAEAFPAEAWRAFPASYAIDASPIAWKKAPESIDYSNISENLNEQNFFAVARGDVDLSWPDTSSVSNLAKAAEADGASPVPLQLVVNSMPIAPGARRVSWQILLEGSNVAQGVFAFGAELRYDAAALKISGVHWGRIVPADAFVLDHNILPVTTTPANEAGEPGVEKLVSRMRFGGFATAAEAIRTTGVLLEVEAQLQSELPAGTRLPLHLVNVAVTTRTSAGNQTANASFVQLKIAAKDGEVVTATVPIRYALEANYPNPFNPSTHIRYQLPEAASVKLEIYNALGQKVRELVKDEQQAAGYYTIAWDGRNALGGAATSGVYFLKLEAKSATQSFTQSHKMLLVK